MSTGNRESGFILIAIVRLWMQSHVKSRSAPGGGENVPGQPRSKDDGD